MKKLGKQIREQRELKGLLLRQVAAKLELDPAILSKIERGERKATKEQVIALAGFFEMDLKELHLTEGRGTGFSAIYKAMADNGSPAPIFETNEQITHVLVTLPAHSLTEINKNDQASDLADNQENAIIFSSLEDIIAFCSQAIKQVGINLVTKLKQYLMTKFILEYKMC